MINKSFPTGSRTGTALGADVGATLLKLATHGSDGLTRFRLLPTDAIEQAAREVESARANRVGLTGGGAPELASLLGFDTTRVNEFDAWRKGADELLGRAGLDSSEPYLLVSLGTGTSAMRVDGETAERVGGTALGGGTLLGLATALLGTASFPEIVELARQGDRREVDLLLSDIYRSGDSPLPGEATASSFAKLARLGPGARPAAPDLAKALMVLVGENVALVCAGLAAVAGVKRVVFGGSSLRGNPPLVGILRVVTAAVGREPIMLPDGEFAGALGALLLAAG